jgi:predicted nucleic acid-binding protein
MAAGVLLDTSFLITLAGSARAHHEAARCYWRHFTENQLPIYLSTIVVSEFCVRQEIDPQLLRSCIVVPFNWDDAQRVATLDWRSLRPPGVERDALKDDIKIIAQAARIDAEYVITDDSESFYRYCETFKAAGKVSFKAIKLADGFDRAFFNGGQRDFADGLSNSEE